MTKIVADPNFGTSPVKLKDCPFCGSVPSYYIRDHSDRSLEAVIDCPNCGAGMSKYLAFGSKEPASDQKAQELAGNWNMRTRDE